MYQLWNVDAVRQIPAWSRDECERNHELLPILW